ncbi:MAG: Ldh family oxidoreductase [Candidatus Entotheonellia bacterium]
MMSGEMMRVPSRALDAFTESVLTKLGIPPGDARIVVDVLSQANLRGVDTHATDLLPGYVQRIREGMVNPNPRMKVIKESVTAMVIDADQALGQVSSRFGMQQAINKALQSGVGWVHVTNSNHNGALAYYTLMAAEQDMIGVVTTTTIACMAPWGSREPLLGNNPLAIAVPCHKHEPLVLDIAFSQQVYGRVSLDEAAAVMQPFGSHKGSGLAMMLGLLCGVLAGQPFTGYRRGRSGRGPSEISHLLIAANIASFTDVAEFKATVDETIESLKNSATSPEVDEVLVPGEVEWRRVADRQEHGIPLKASLVNKLIKIANELALEFPATV